MDNSHYQYENADCNFSHEYLLPPLIRVVNQTMAGGRIFELGCGSGGVANELSRIGFEVVGVDPSRQGIDLANVRYPHLNLSLGSSEDDLAARFGQFPLVMSIEVIEHVWAPRQFARRIYDLLEPGGLAIISTPYHGYLKNLMLAITGHLDAHFTAMWDNGHIKFWSVKTLNQLLTEAGFEGICFQFVGRIPVLAKSMIATARKPLVG